MSLLNKSARLIRPLRRVIALQSSICALHCPPVSLADQLVDVGAARTGVDDRRPGLPAVHRMGHEFVELGEVNARPVLANLAGG
jgi:hypothetical protein